MRQATGTVTFERIRHNVPAGYADAFAVTVFNHSGLTGAMRTPDFDAHTTPIRGEENSRQKSLMFAPGEGPFCRECGDFKTIRLFVSVGAGGVEVFGIRNRLQPV